MTLSVWRFSHMLLALASSLFLLLASVTGIILAFEPLVEGSKPYSASFNEQTIGQTLEILEAQYPEILSLEVDRYDRVLLEGIDAEGASFRYYVDPQSGKKLGEPEEKNALFRFTTNLHRSLFLKSVGRFFVGLVSFLMCMITITGFLLLLQRQGGWKKLYSKIPKEDKSSYYHVILGRWLIVPILIVGATGVYLSLEKFSLLPPLALEHRLPEQIDETMNGTASFELELFKKTPLEELRKLSYPFSEFPEDYFEVALQDRELWLHQYTGEALSELSYPFTTIAQRWSMLLHTGQGSLWWAVVLLLVGISLVYFLYSGIRIWATRTRKTKKSSIVPIAAEEADAILLVGSETGNTFAFAALLQKALLDLGKQTHVAELNSYQMYPKAEELIILTATYGEGEHTTNGRHFLKLLDEVSQQQTLNYSVVGFGSLQYPDFCAFAIDIDKKLAELPGFEENNPLFKINNQDFRAFETWAQGWSAKSGQVLKLEPLKKKKKKRRYTPFEVIEKSALNLDDTFTLKLRPQKKAKFTSGDLAGILAEDGNIRQYSIAKVAGDLVLSVKKHEHGLCSTYLSQLAPGDSLMINLQKNHDFHLPGFAQQVLLIGNGTGIAPYLGMLEQHHSDKEIHLLAGLRTKESYELYKPYLEAYPPQTLELAFSQEKDGQYVQDILQQKASWVAKGLENEMVIMICGSLKMQNGVLEVLENICQTELGVPLSDFENLEQIRMDCY